MSKELLGGVLQNGEIRITSLELVDIINEYRRAEAITTGKKYTENKHKSLLAKIDNEIKVLKANNINQQNFLPVEYKDSKGEMRRAYSLNRDGVLEMLNSESPLVRYRTTEYINSLEKKLQEVQNQKANLLLAIYEGGQYAVEASRQLTAIEIKEATKELQEDNNTLATALDNFTNTTDTYDIGVFTKILGIKGFGRTKMFQWLRDNGILMSNNSPYQNYAKYFKTILVEKGGQKRIKPLLKGNGIIYIIKKLIDDNKLNKSDSKEIISKLEELKNNSINK